MAREFKAMKEMMSLLSNELIKIKLNSSRNQGDHPRQLVAQNNYSQNQTRNFGGTENFEVPKLHEVAKGDENVKDPEVGEIFESESHQEEDTDSSYCDIDSPLDNDKIPP